MRQRFKSDSWSRWQGAQSPNLAFMEIVWFKRDLRITHCFEALIFTRGLL